MLQKLFIAGYILSLALTTSAQQDFNFTIDLQPVNIPGLPGLQSYAYAQHDGKWLIIGGRKDGIHARQPFNAYPETENNTNIYVIDINTQQFWTASLNALPTGIKEQLQSTNMNFYQEEDTLYIIGGYAFSTTANDHITFPNLTTVNVPSLINAIINGTTINANFKQITNPVFAVTGGRLGKVGDMFYLVGGQKFDGQYNPMGHATYVQTYTNRISKFKINNAGTNLNISNYSAIIDPIHLRRRDYNLLPQIFPNREQGYTISSGVFQIGANLPFLYPVDITSAGYKPITNFNQYLSNYHSAFATLYDSIGNRMHTLFFGGISQYFYQNGTLVQDNQVPFVNTISRLTRYPDGTLQEYQLPVQMPGLRGAGAEFIPNQLLPHYSSDIIKLSKINQDTIFIGHIYGGILSPIDNPFSSNQSYSTVASSTVYAVRLVKNIVTGIQPIDGSNPFDLSVYPNPIDTEIQVRFNLAKKVKLRYFLSGTNGELIQQGLLTNLNIGTNEKTIQLEGLVAQQTYFLTFIFDDKFFVSRKIQKN